MNLSTKIAVCAFFFAAILGRVSAVLATPPTPPAQLQIPNEAELSKIQVRQGISIYCSRITQSRGVATHYPRSYSVDRSAEAHGNQQ